MAINDWMNQIPLEDLSGRETTWLRNLGLTNDYLNPAQQWLSAQYRPMERLYGLAGRMAANPNMPMVGNFGDWANTYMARYNPNTPSWALPPVQRGGANTTAPNTLAQGLLSRIFGATSDQRSNMGTTYEPTASLDKYGQPTGGMSYENGDLSELQALLHMALRPKMGYEGSSFLAGKLPQVAAPWAARNPATGGGGGSFLDYLNSKFGLSRFAPPVY